MFTSLVRFGSVVILGLFASIAITTTFAAIQDSTEFNIVVENVSIPETCSPHGWSIPYDRTINRGDLRNLPLWLYGVQYVNDDLNLVHYWGSGYNAYVQDYMVESGLDSLARAVGSYAVPLWTDSYHAVTIEYVLQEDHVIWEVRAELTCEAGIVIDAQITSQAADRSRESLPASARNLVLALEDIPRYRNEYSQTGYLGTIYACQTFTMRNIYMPRASISTYGTDSLTNQPMLLNGVNAGKIIDVPEDYGQPDGTPILDVCA